jgi:hypothetical protein
MMFNILNNVDNLIRTRPISSYTDEDLKEINLISITDHPLVIGSISFVMQKYPSDIDLHDELIENGPPIKVVKDATKRIQKVIKDELNMKCHYITDIKAGIDQRFNLSIGKLENGFYFPNLNNLGILMSILPVSTSDTIYELMRDYKNNTHGYKIHDILEKIIREYKIIRWKPEEVLKGEKIKNGKLITFEQALMQDSTVKIDVATFIDERFTEVSNNYFLASIYDGQLHFINTSYNFTEPIEILKNYIPSVKAEIEKLFYSDDFNPFKGLKRIWVLSRMLYKYGNLSVGIYIKIITPIISGGLSALNQIKSEISTIELLQSQGKGSQCIQKNSSRIASRWRNTIGHVLDIANGEMQQLLFLVESPKDLEKALKNVINNKTMDTIKNTILWPIPNLFLPLHRSYPRPIH